MRAVYYLSALEQARLLRQRKISARELLKLSRERVEKYQSGDQRRRRQRFRAGGEGGRCIRSQAQAR